MNKEYEDLTPRQLADELEKNQHNRTYCFVLTMAGFLGIGVTAALLNLEIGLLELPVRFTWGISMLASTGGLIGGVVNWVNEKPIMAEVKKRHFKLAGGFMCQRVEL